MTTMHQFRVRWTGALGLPGVNTFYFTGSVATAKTDLTTFYTAMKSLAPAPIQFTIPGTGMDIDSTNGKAVGTWSAGTDTTISATGTGNYVAAAGMVINWRTGIFLDGRELRGKTFFVPTIQSTYSTDGTLNNTDRAGVESGAQTLAGSTATMVVYSRTGDLTGTVSTASVPDKVAILRTRRD